MAKNTKELIEEIKKDYESRKEARVNVERNWLLNINFLVGNQYSNIMPNGQIETRTKDFYWQEREVYNHIAPIIETRLSKFANLKGNVTVRPASKEDEDINAAKFSTSLIKSVEDSNNMSSLVNESTFWSEVCGTAFYKIAWAENKGRVIGEKEGRQYFEGDVEISVCSPYEIYPDNLACSTIDECASIIYAKAFPIETIENVWGVKVNGREISTINMDSVDGGGGFGYVAKSKKLFADKKKNHELVIERYTLPNNQYEKGRLEIIAGDKLLYEGDLPYKNGQNGERHYPFVRQTCLVQPASFFGQSVIDRLIPVQRAYNSVKNQKHEFLNRISMGVLMVEDGSIDLDAIEEEGLAPGKVIVYRQGSNTPVMMNMGSVPNDFKDEEDRLLNEFVTISGVSDFLTSSTISENISGVALGLIIEQENNRLSITSESIRNAIKETGKHILRLYKQFANSERLIRITGEDGGIEQAAFENSLITSDDLVFDIDNELTDTLSSRKTIVSELFQMGLLNDENGKIKDSSRIKILEMMGLGNWESSLDTEELHMNRAKKENGECEKRQVEAADYDNHEIHITAHTAYLVSEGECLTLKHKENLKKHLKMHRTYLRLEKEAEALNI